MFFQLKMAAPYEKRPNLPLFSAFFRRFLSVGLPGGSVAAVWPVKLCWREGRDVWRGNEKSRKLVKVCGSFAN
jgi:hypothetical protein